MLSGETLPDPDLGEETEWGGEPQDSGDTGKMVAVPVEHIDRFVIRRVLGSGGMSVVYDGFDPELHRRVAVKVLRNRSGSDDGGHDRDLIMREAQAMARLNHPNVITVYQVGEHERQVYIAMELVEGVTLREWVGQEHRNRSEILAMFLQAGRGLSAAHAADLIHRDFKPENVLVGRDGRVRVLDLGLARGAMDVAARSPDTSEAPTDTADRLARSLTRTGAIMGTPLYMAPEQHLMEAMDARADQFAFCVALFEALYGVRPFDGQTYPEFAANVVNGRVREQPPNSDVPAWLDRVVRRGLSRDPEDRYPTMDLLLQDIVAAQEYEEARAGRARAEVEGARAAVLRQDLLEARAKLRGALEVEDSPVARALWWQLSRSPIKWARRVGSRLTSVAASADGAQIVAGGGDGCAHLVDVSSLRTRVIRTGRYRIGSVTMSEDGSVYAGSERGLIHVWAHGETGLRTLEGHGGAVYGLAAFDGGRRLVSSSFDGTLRVWDPAAGRTVATMRGHEGLVAHVDATPDGLVASVGVDGTLRVWSADDGRQLACLRGHVELAPRGFVCFSPDGKMLAAEAETDHAIALWRRKFDDPGQWERIGELVGHTDAIPSARWLPDGRRLASAAYDGTLRVWDTDEAKLLRTYRAGGQLFGVIPVKGARYVATVGDDVKMWDLVVADADDRSDGHGLPAVTVAFDHRGKRLVSGGDDGFVRTWDLETGRQQLRHEVGETVTSVAFSSDDRRLFVGQYSRAIRVWDLATGIEGLPLLGHDAGVSVVTDVDDGHVASTGWDGTVRVWDAERGIEVQRLGGGPWAFALAADGAGRRLAQAGESWIQVWDRNLGTGESVPDVGQKNLWGLAWHPRRDALAWGGSEGVVVVNDFEEQTRVTYGALEVQVNRIVFSSDGDTLGAAYADGIARLWNLRAGTCQELDGHRESVFCIAFSPDGERVATGSDDGTVRLWSARSGRPLWWGKLMTSDLLVLSHRGWERAGAGKERAATRWQTRVQERGRRVAASDESAWVHTGSRLECWDRLNDELRGSWAVPRVDRLAVVGDWCLVDSGNGLVRYDDSGPGWRVENVGAWSLVGDQLWVASEDGISCWTPDGARVRELPGARGVTAVSRVGDRVILGFEEGALEVAPQEEGEIGAISFEDHPPSRVRRIVEGPMGTVVGAYDSGTIGLWSPTDGKSLYRAKLHGAIAFIAYQDGYLHALSELGDRLRLDLRVFEQPYPQLLREVWREVPVVWREGLAVLEPPPKNHPLAL